MAAGGVVVPGLLQSIPWAAYVPLALFAAYGAVLLYDRLRKPRSEKAVGGVKYIAHGAKALRDFTDDMKSASRFELYWCGASSQVPEWDELLFGTKLESIIVPHPGTCEDFGVALADRYYSGDVEKYRAELIGVTRAAQQLLNHSCEAPKTRWLKGAQPADLILFVNKDMPDAWAAIVVPFGASGFATKIVASEKENRKVFNEIGLALWSLQSSSSQDVDPQTLESLEQYQTLL